jgi:hypothetical protein
MNKSKTKCYKCNTAIAKTYKQLGVNYCKSCYEKARLMKNLDNLMDCMAFKEETKARLFGVDLL